MSKSKIEWTERTWNVMSGCTKVSEGCKNCYAEKMANRLQAMGAKGYENGFAVTLHPDKLDEPLRRKKPTMFFVCSMGDLLHKDVDNLFIFKIFDVMQRCPQHTFQVLTKRPERLKQIMRYMRDHAVHINGKTDREFIDSIKHIWIGVTAENQEQADKRIPILLDTPAAVRFVSIEPMLSEINLQKLHRKMVDGALAYPFDLDWVIVGGETGAGARPLQYEWVKSIQTQCKSSETPLFFKKWGKNQIEKDGFIDGVEYRQMPEVKNEK